MELGYIHTEAAIRRQRFARKFEQDSLVHSSKVSHIQDEPLIVDWGQFAIHFDTNSVPGLTKEPGLVCR
jgi:hypothetical protein